MNNKKYNDKHMNDFSKVELEHLAQRGQLIDVRTNEEYALGHINDAKLHPVEEIETFNQPNDKTYYIYCKSGGRSAKASSYLSQQGYDIVNVDGGYTSFEEKNVEIKANRKQFNYSGMQCPGPIVNMSKEIKNSNVGDQIEVTVTDPGFHSDIQSWVKQTGHTLVSLEESNKAIVAVIQKEKPKELEVSHSANGTTIVLFSGELDKAIAAMIIANGAKAAGRDVTIFFTFWGLNALKKYEKVNVKKKGIAKMFDFMLPNSPVRMPISKMNMFGLGNVMMRYVMKKKNVDSLPALMNQAIEQDVKFIACTMSMDVMGITKEELRDEVSYGGVGTYIGDTEQASHNLFI
ncbi:DsrE/DsrF/DrsH-like family protein [Mammaliicoccus sp. Dog046]|uniref:DsrE/DsrF/DrsH-like family protein n=1 Tax=Mammaliicoccus sp. Dog046 TaxID=3034233 RepID=UPI002B25FE5B|nr:DsrE/DsrF/DrsH-like family protein [Mammaliicoccus sp. Dog046]WQK85553.1 DsrE/DsrF/DrsH-like family protein [Mammaliicoccus sp. Dog046]